VLAAHSHAGISPSGEVSLDVDRSTNALLLPDRPVLLEGRRAVDGGLVGTGGLKDVVSATINGDGSLLSCCRGWVVAAVRLNDVVLNKRVACPAVERDVGVHVLTGPGTAVVDNASASWVPSLATNPVAHIVPLARVLPSSLLTLERCQ
jgi:hypothetical protein